MYLTENLQEKWQPVLEHPDLPKIGDSYKRAVTTVILENQEKAVREDRGFMTEAAPGNSVAGGGVDNWDPVLISLVRRAMPNLIAYDVCGVQPMTGPTGLKGLFKEHYIEVPEEKYNVLDDLTNQVKDLESKLNEQIEKNVNLSKEVSESTKTSLIADVIADLADTEKEKFVKMAENVEFESASKFKEKLETVKESYFPKSKIEEATSTDEVDSVAANIPADAGTSDAMAAYTAAISKDLKTLNQVKL